MNPTDLPTRRTFLAAGVATGGALAWTPAQAPGALAGTQADAAVIATTLGVEQLLSLAYRTALASGALSQGAELLVRELLGHELQHAAALRRELVALGGQPPTGPTDAASGEKALAAHHVSGSLAALHTEQDAIKLLMALESVAEGSYYVAIGQLSDSALIRTSAAIMACEAQHASALSELLHPGDVSRAAPDAFVQGTH
jgi:hypothetical protein